MIENELETSRKTLVPDYARISELTNWFRFDYPMRLNAINRHKYLNLPLPESRYSLELEAYNKENELRSLKGLDPLPELKIKEIL
jgi:hypothetical protein